MKRLAAASEKLEIAGNPATVQSTAKTTLINMIL